MFELELGTFTHIFKHIVGAQLGTFLNILERVRENFWLGLGVFKQTKTTGVAKCHLSVSLSRKSLGYSSE